MKRDAALATLRRLEPELRKFGVARLFLFGSMARDQAREGSDLDVFVDPADPSFYELGNYMGLYDLLSASFPAIAVGYSTRRGLSAFVRSEVEREAIRVF